MWDLVGKKIKSLRKALGDNQAEFGERFGVEQATVSRWEKGEPVQRKHQEPTLPASSARTASLRLPTARGM